MSLYNVSRSSGVILVSFCPDDMFSVSVFAGFGVCVAIFCILCFTIITYTLSKVQWWEYLRMDTGTKCFDFSDWSMHRSDDRSLGEWNIMRAKCPSFRAFQIDCLKTDLQPQTFERPTTYYISHNFHTKSGLGNLLFMYASMWGIAKKNNLTVSIRHSVLHDIMDLSVPATNDFNLSHCGNFVFGRKKCCVYDPKSENLFDKTFPSNVSLFGYYQSFKYFHPEFTDDIRREFMFKDNVAGRAREVIQRLVSEINGNLSNSNARPIVGIHVRRGDVLIPDRVQFGHTVATREYFQNAANYLRTKNVKDPIFIVCTNDVIWSRENLPFHDIAFVEGQSPEVDLAILASADHLILSVGTYSFFAGYLSNATNILYYSRWPEPGSGFDKWFQRSDFWLPDWVPLE